MIQNKKSKTAKLVLKRYKKQAFPASSVSPHPARPPQPHSATDRRGSSTLSTLPNSARVPPSPSPSPRTDHPNHPTFVLVLPPNPNAPPPRSNYPQNPCPSSPPPHRASPPLDRGFPHPAVQALFSRIFRPRRNLGGCSAPPIRAGRGLRGASRMERRTPKVRAGRGTRGKEEVSLPRGGQYHHPCRHRLPSLLQRQYSYPRPDLDEDVSVRRRPKR